MFIRVYSHIFLVPDDKKNNVYTQSIDIKQNQSKPDETQLFFVFFFIYI